MTALPESPGSIYDQEREILDGLIASLQRKQFGERERQALDRLAEMTRPTAEPRPGADDALFGLISRVRNEVSARVPVAFDEGPQRGDGAFVPGIEFESVRTRVARSLIAAREGVDQLQDRTERQEAARREAHQRELTDLKRAIAGDPVFGAVMELLVGAESKLGSLLHLRAAMLDAPDSVRGDHEVEVLEAGRTLEPMRVLAKMHADRLRRSLGLEHLPTMAAQLVPLYAEHRGIAHEARIEGFGSPRRIILFKTAHTPKLKVL
jgi:hypothetical protein